MRLNKFNYLLIIFFLLVSFSFISASQNFLDKKISYEYGKFTPEIRQGEKLNNYFKNLEIPEDEIYVLLEFNKDNKEIGLNSLEKDNIKKIGKYSNDIYVGRYPSATGYEIDGIIDEIGIWSRVLTYDEVQELYNSGNGLSYN